MTRYVIEPEVALTLAKSEAKVPRRHHLLAPTLLRSQVLAQLFVEVKRGELTRKEADRHLDYVRRLGVRLLGDRVLQRVAWQVAMDLGWEDTFAAEYLALTKLQADALVTCNAFLADTVRPMVAVATVEDLLS